MTYRSLMRSGQEFDRATPVRQPAHHIPGICGGPGAGMAVEISNVHRGSALHPKPARAQVTALAYAVGVPANIRRRRRKHDASGFVDGKVDLAQVGAAGT